MLMMVLWEIRNFARENRTARRANRFDDYDYDYDDGDVDDDYYDDEYHDDDDADDYGDD